MGIVSVAELRAEYDGRWLIANLKCPTCQGTHTSLHPEITPKVECPYCHDFIAANVIHTVRVINLDDGDFEFEGPNA